MIRILYLVHDLNDPAVCKRIIMLQQGGAEVTMAGFRRGTEPVHNLAGCHTINLGQTYNAKFIQRILAVIREVIFLKKHHSMFATSDIIIARNLEMLAIGVRGKNLCHGKITLIYESLDIHRLLLNQGIVGKILRKLEGQLSKKTSAVITSSPAFIREYFDPLSEIKLPIKLIENKVYYPNAVNNPILTINTKETKSWKIGWFGIIRCKKSLDILSELVKRSDGNVEVIIRGRPSLDQFDDFYKTITSVSGLKFLGEYKNPDDLASIYGEVHFTWTIDMFEEEKNSSWLLPNRLYEGCLYGSIPIADSSVETGRFINNLGIGIVTKKEKIEFLTNFFKLLTKEKYYELQKTIAKIPPSQWLYDINYCKELVIWLGSFSNLK